MASGYGKLRILVTGGAGFIGGHLVDHLMNLGHEVRVIDNLSAGSLKNLGKWLDDPRLEFVEGDLLRHPDVEKAVAGCEVVYHLAANPEVRSWLASPEDHFRQNVEATYNLLEAMRGGGEAEALVFTSSSTVYGEAPVPTPEGYAPLRPISLYGASKLAAEALISAYAHMYGFRGVVYRMANVVGPRCSHGVVHDFVEKLRANPRQLEILGDGSQSKSYLHVDDFVEGMLFGLQKTRDKVEVLNIGSEDRVGVETIARIVIEEMGLRDVDLRLTGGVDGGRGWRGDIKLMQLDVSRMRALGWRPRLGSADAVRETVRSLIKR
jgi:UDP-glucose 4-epimerase